MATSTRSGLTGTTSVVAIVAVIGWITSIYFFTQQREMGAQVQELAADRAALQQDLNAQRAASGTLAELDAAIERLSPELEEATTQRAAVQTELNQLTLQREEAQATLAAIVAEQAAGRAAVEEANAQVQPLRDELADYENRRAELEAQVATQTEEMALVGSRLEEARVREAEVRQTLSDLTAEMATLSENAAAAEIRLQTALQEAAAIEQSTAQIRQEVIRLEEESGGLEQEIVRLRELKSTLTEDVAATQGQRDERQDVLSRLTEDIAARSQDLLRIERQLEARIAQQNATNELETKQFDLAIAGIPADEANSGTDMENPVTPGSGTTGSVEPRVPDAGTPAGLEAETPANESTSTEVDQLTEAEQQTADAEVNVIDEPSNDTAAAAAPDAATNAVTDDMPSMQAGRYLSEGMTLTLTESDEFEITGDEANLSGQYTLQDGWLRLVAEADAEGRGTTEMECQFTDNEDGGFDFTAEQENCDILAGRSFSQAPN
jgi:predicted  nucleic acid-binding Zn-ribbon protein